MGLIVAGMSTPADIFFINTDLLCSCLKTLISQAFAVATPLRAYCVVRVDLHFSQDLIKNLARREVCNLGAGAARSCVTFRPYDSSAFIPTFTKTR